MREVRVSCVAIFLRGNVCGAQMSLTLVFSDDLSHSSTFPECGLLNGGKTRRHGGGCGGAAGVVTIDPCGRGWRDHRREGPVFTTPALGTAVVGRCREWLGRTF